VAEGAGRERAERDFAAFQEFGRAAAGCIAGGEGKGGSRKRINKSMFGILLRWAMGLTNWLVTGDITHYIPIISF
jgi:hypothetical protein